MEAIRGGGDDGDIGSKSEVWGSRFVKWEDLASKEAKPKVVFLRGGDNEEGGRAKGYRLQATGYSTRAASKCKRHQGEIFGVDAKVKWMRKFSINIHF
ncbi:hypothetical protein NC653_015057 [Populus alba x Populus x berolinensis]|uniref:Uncharacterized protein n=1 Tax=Populus alba x Populus x berolinensis TaxID=444605 RepID=A0AAD6QYL3_9ROSI|nr:hypothetical protein NC653_015057 [Populus alba x Populus x berolinensis]